MNFNERIEVAVDRDYGADETFECETEAEARALYRSLIGQPDVRRVWAFIGSEELHWSAS